MANIRFLSLEQDTRSTVINHTGTQSVYHTLPEVCQTINNVGIPDSNLPGADIENYHYGSRMDLSRRPTDQALPSHRTVSNTTVCGFPWMASKNAPGHQYNQCCYGLSKTAVTNCLTVIC